MKVLHTHTLRQSWNLYRLFCIIVKLCSLFIFALQSIILPSFTLNKLGFSLLLVIFRNDAKQKTLEQCLLISSFSILTRVMNLILNSRSLRYWWIYSGGQEEHILLERVSESSSIIYTVCIIKQSTSLSRDSESSPQDTVLLQFQENSTSVIQLKSIYIYMYAWGTHDYDFKGNQLILKKINLMYNWIL